MGAGGGDFGVAQRRAMHIVAAFFIGRTLADFGAAADQRRAGSIRLGGDDGGVQRGKVVAVDGRNHLPAIGFKALDGVVGEPAFHIAINRDAVVVVEGNQLAQAPGAGQRAGFVRNAFHQAAITQEHPGVVIDNGVAVAVEFSRQDFFRQRHAHRVGDALTQRAGGGFHARRVAVFRMAGGFAVPLTEGFQVVNRQVVAGQVQEAVQQH